MIDRIVSFEVAKAIEKIGFPQPDKNSGITNVYPLEDHDDNFTPYTRIGKLTTNYHCQTFRVLSDIPFVGAPTYIDVWLWLWREKKYPIDVDCYNATHWSTDIVSGEFTDPEEAIVEAIDYLVDNNLIK